MPAFPRIALAALIGLSSLAAGPSVSLAADLGAYAPYDSGVCAEAWVRKKIATRFRHQVRHVPHLPDVEILEFANVQESRYLPAAERNPIGRRYCTADVALSDGHSRDIWYLIEEGQGYAGVGDNVEFCVSGFDRWLVYNGRCRILR